MVMNIESFIRDIPDFPKKGIQFKDITPLLNNVEAFRSTIDLMSEKIEDCDVFVGVESRGFLFAAALAYKLGKRFVPVRKKGKLPAATYSQEYELEYGTDKIEIHQDALNPNDRVIIVDDLLATGGTVSAVEKLVAKCGVELVGTLFLIELGFLAGREKLENKNIVALINY